MHKMEDNNYCAMQMMEYPCALFSFVGTPSWLEIMLMHHSLKLKSINLFLHHLGIIAEAQRYSEVMSGRD